MSRVLRTSAGRGCRNEFETRERTARRDRTIKYNYRWGSASADEELRTVLARDELIRTNRTVPEPSRYDAHAARVGDDEGDE